MVAGVVAMLCVAACAPAGGRALREPSRSPAAEVSGRDPVIIVPGWALECRHGPATEWQPWIDALFAAGWTEAEVYVVDYDTCAAADQNAARVAAAVDALLTRTGAARVTLIAHSMGVIAARWCVRFGDCAARVGSVVTLSGANHGTTWAGLCGLQYWSVACLDMQPESATLAALNAGDETPDGGIPGGIAWQAWVSICELGIVPRSSAMLDGAENHDLTDRCILHDDWKRDGWAIDTIVGSLVGSGPG